MFERIRSRLGLLRRARRFNEELDEEMSFHLDRLAEDLVRGGMSPKEARREARRRFGSTERAKARTREERGLALFDETARNLRFAVRGMMRSPLFSTTSILTLAFCIGLGAAVFSVVDSLLWKPLPYPHPEDLAQAEVYTAGFGKNPQYTNVDGWAWERIRDEATFLDRAVYSGQVVGVNLSTDGSAVFVRQQRVGAGYFHTLGVLPRMGREFDAAEDVPDGPAVAVLGNGLWKRSFGGDPDIVGKVIRLKGKAYTVVGVMPRNFRSPSDVQPDVWTPLQPNTQGEGSGSNYHVIVRAPLGMSLDEADARVAAIRPAERTLKDNPDARFGLLPLGRTLAADVRRPVLILLGAILLMMVVGCANIAGLQVARALARRAEMATRKALGGGTGALVRQMAAENLVLGLFGGVVGLAVAYASLVGLRALVQTRFSLWQDIGMDRGALLVVLGFTLVATLLFGLAPVLQVRNRTSHRLLVSGSRGTVGGGSHVLRKVLLVGEVAMVTTLLFAAGLLVRSYGHLQGLAPGFDARGVLTVQYSLDDARYSDAGAVRRLFDRTVRDIDAIPGVSSSAVALTLPYETPLNLGIHIQGTEANDLRWVNAVYVSPAFFRTLGIPVLRGRAFDEGDGPDRQVVAVVNQALAARDFADASPVGKRIHMWFADRGDVEIVGVVGNVLQSAGYTNNPEPVWETPTVYLPAAQASSGFLRGVHVWFSPSWIIRASGAHPDLSARVTAVFRNIDPDLPVARLALLREIMDEAFALPRFEAGFLIVVALFALLLAGVGLYGMVAHEVLQRRSEMGLRMALGATPGSAVWTAGATGVRLTALGLLAGAALSVPVARLLAHVIWGVAPWDPVTLGGILAVLALLAGVASFLPAARVRRMDPATILRAS